MWPAILAFKTKLKESSKSQAVTNSEQVVEVISQNAASRPHSDGLLVFNSGAT